MTKVEVQYDENNIPIPDGQITLLLSDGSERCFKFRFISWWKYTTERYMFCLADDRTRREYPVFNVIEAIICMNSSEYTEALQVAQLSCEHDWKVSIHSDIIGQYEVRTCKKCNSIE